MKKYQITTIILFILITLQLFPGVQKKDETIIFPSTYGWIANGEINISLHAWIFEIEEDSLLRKSFISLLEGQFENAGTDEKKNFENRIRYFLIDNKRNKQITINVNDDKFNLQKTSPDGHSLSIIKIKNNSSKISSDERVNFSSLSPDKENRTFTGTIQIIGEKGFSIISDIDDTIKESNVADKNELLKNTFLRKFKPVNGMAELYRNFESKGAVFHYVSGSPWQLYPTLHTFIQDEHFPEGAFEMKLFRVKDKSFINFIKADQLTYKLDAIKTIIERFPQRKFILVGDSGEKDPEVYAEIASLYKDRIKYIFIRDVGLIEEHSLRKKNIIEKAGKIKVVIFKEAGELKAFTAELQ